MKIEPKSRGDQH